MKKCKPLFKKSSHYTNPPLRFMGFPQTKTDRRFFNVIFRFLWKTDRKPFLGDLPLPRAFPEQLFFIYIPVYHLQSGCY